MPQRRSRTSRKNKTSDRRIAKIAKKVLYKNSETKCKMIHFNESSFTTGAHAYYYDPMNISEGTGPDNRVGQQITLSGYQLKGVFKSNAPNEHQYIRMILFYAKDRSNFDVNSELHVSSNHLPLTGATIGGLDKIYHPLNKALVTPLYDKTIKIAPYSNTQSDGTRLFNFFVKLHNRKISFENTATGVDNVSPRLHLAVITAGASDDELTSTVEMSAFQRLWYKDI